MKTSCDLYGDTDKIREEIYNIFNTNDEDMTVNVAIIKNWCETQRHLPEIPSEKIIESFLIFNKLSIEKTKSKIDMYYTIRSIFPEIYDHCNPRQPHIKNCLDVVFWVPLSHSQSCYRINIYKLNDTDPDHFDPSSFLMSTINLSETRLHEDCCMGEQLIYDFHGVTLAHLVKTTPTFLAKMNAIIERVFSARLAGIHLLGPPPFADFLLKVLKSILKPKIAGRIHIHEDLESLMKHFPREILPKDYGGDEKSLQQLNDLVKLKLAEYQERFDLLDTLRVDESLRAEPLKNDDTYGFYGNFKKLNVD